MKLCHANHAGLALMPNYTSVSENGISIMSKTLSRVRQVRHILASACEYAAKVSAGLFQVRTDEVGIGEKALLFQ